MKPRRLRKALSPLALLFPVLALALTACGGGEGDPAVGDPPELQLFVERPVDAPRPVGAMAPGAMAPPVVRLGVADPEASVAFYRDLLGFSLSPSGAPARRPAAAEVPGDPPAVRLVHGELQIELLLGRGAPGAAPRAPAAGQPVLLVEVADAAALFDRVGDRVELVRALTDRADGRREFAVSDPDGHLLVVSQRF